MTQKENRHIIKTRDDHIPVYFERQDTVSDVGDLFRLAPDADCSWPNTGDTFGTEELRHRVEPWLTALFQSEHLSLLVGSGLHSRDPLDSQW